MNNNWKKVKLTDIAEIIMGQSPPSKFYNETGEGLPFFQGRTEFQELYPKIIKYCSKPQRIALNNDILMTVRAPVGDLNLLNIKCCIGRGLCAIRPICKKDKWFIYYLLKGNLNSILSNETGSIYGSINKGDILALEFNSPPNIIIRRTIGKFLSNYDELIENNNRRIQILEKMAQLIYDEWFVKFKFPGHEKTKFVDSELGQIPEGWDICCVKDLIDIKSGFSFKTKSFDSDGEYGLVTIKNVQDSKFVNKCTNNIKVIPDRMPEYCFLNTGDILLSLTGNIGRTCLVFGNNYLLNQRVAKLIPKQYFYSYAYSLFKDDTFKIKLENIANGVAQQNLSPIETGKLQVLKPDDEIIKLFEKNTKKLLDNILFLHKKNLNLEKTRDLLLPKLISGEINIENFKSE